PRARHTAQVIAARLLDAAAGVTHLTELDDEDEPRDGPENGPATSGLACWSMLHHWTTMSRLRTRRPGSGWDWMPPAAGWPADWHDKRSGARRTWRTRLTTAYARMLSGNRTHPRATGAMNDHHDQLATIVPTAHPPVEYWPLDDRYWVRRSPLPPPTTSR